MHLTQIKNPADPSLLLIRNLYETSFPLHERRTWHSFIKVLATPAMQLFLLAEEDFVGFIITWKLEDFLYVEHFAISPELRGKQYGGKVLDSIIQLAKSKVILEVEPEHDEDSKRRISFYKRKGFHTIPFAYMQPPYRRNESPHAMLLMSIPEIQSQQEFKKITNLIKKHVYEEFYE